MGCLPPILLPVQQLTNQITTSNNGRNIILVFLYKIAFPGKLKKNSIPCSREGSRAWGS